MAMHKAINPENVRTNLLRLSKVSLGLDAERPPAGLQLIEPESGKDPQANRLAAIRYRGNGSGRFFVQHPVGLLTRLMYR